MGADYSTCGDSMGVSFGMVRYTDSAVMAAYAARVDAEYAANFDRMMRGEAPVVPARDGRYDAFVRASPAARAARGNAAYVRATVHYRNGFDVAYANGAPYADSQRAGMVAFCDHYGYDYPDFMEA